MTDTPNLDNILHNGWIPAWVRTPPNSRPTRQPSKWAISVCFPIPPVGPFVVTDAPPVYDSVHTSSFVDNELALGMRGMVVEDDYTQNIRQTNASQGSVPHIRAPPPQGRSPYNAFPQPDLSGAYYPSECHVNCASRSVVDNSALSQIMADHRRYTRALDHKQCIPKNFIAHSPPCSMIMAVHLDPQHPSSITPLNLSFTLVTRRC